MVSHINTFALSGIEAITVDVQTHLSPGLPNFNIVGLPDKLIAESKERVRAAINSLGLSHPSTRITINLSPADILKEGTHYDLAITIGILQEMGIIAKNITDPYFFCAELSLDGNLSEVSGILPASIHSSSLNKGIICSESNVKEALLGGNKKIIALKNLSSIIQFLRGSIKVEQPILVPENNNIKQPDFNEVIGQESAKRAIEIAAAGEHNLLMTGPPGSGKSMLAARIPSILPNLTPEEILEVNIIKSIASNISNSSFSALRPFRSPHHSISLASMVGGGKKVTPGEISLAHNGILFLDELPEFPRNTIEALRQPLETGSVNISRVNSNVTYPAKFQLIAAMNPCRCGYFGDLIKQCHKSPRCANDYRAKISGPILDRFDMQIEVSSLKPEKLTKETTSESSAIISKRVQNARKNQYLRYLDKSSNGKVSSARLQESINFSEASNILLNKLYEQLGLSMRSYYKIMRVARTIADLENSQAVEEEHLFEATNYRINFY